MRRLFYDTSCPICKRIVRRIKSINDKKIFMISSLDGKKAKLIFQGNYAFLRKKKSKMVILEGQKVWMKSNAMLRPYWLMGGKWRILGVFSFIPSFMMAPFIYLASRIMALCGKK